MTFVQRWPTQTLVECGLGGILLFLSRSPDQSDRASGSLASGSFHLLVGLRHIHVGPE